MGEVFENLTQEDLCDLMCGTPEKEPDESEEFAADNDLEDGTIILEPHCTLKRGIVGITEDRCHVVYSFEKLTEALAEDFTDAGADSDDAQTMAIEWLDYNTIRSIGYMPEEYRPFIIMEPVM